MQLRQQGINESGQGLATLFQVLFVAVVLVLILFLFSPSFFSFSRAELSTGQACFTFSLSSRGFCVPSSTAHPRRAGSPIVTCLDSRQAQFLEFSTLVTGTSLKQSTPNSTFRQIWASWCGTPTLVSFRSRLVSVRTFPLDGQYTGADSSLSL